MTYRIGTHEKTGYTKELFFAQKGTGLRINRKGGHEGGKQQAAKTGRTERGPGKSLNSAM